jgi:hypothetical protein
MDASLLWPITVLLIAVLAYKLTDKHFSTRNISSDVNIKLKDLESKVNEMSLRFIGRK